MVRHHLAIGGWVGMRGGWERDRRGMAGLGGSCEFPFAACAFVVVAGGVVADDERTAGGTVTGRHWFSLFRGMRKAPRLGGASGVGARVSCRPGLGSSGTATPTHTSHT